MRAPLLTFGVIAAAVLAAACGGNDDGPSATPDGATIAPAEVVNLRAVGSKFSLSTITVEAGLPVEIEFTSQDGAPHNFAVYTTSAAQEEIYVGDTFTGPDKSQTEKFDAPDEPGEYFFRCDVHPDAMTGTLVVR